MADWSNNWDSTAKKAIAQAGYQSVSDLCDRHPGLTYVQLSKSVIEGVVAPAQIRILQLEEAVFSGRLLRALRDCFVRTFNEHVRHGWAEGFRWDYNAASIVASMQATLKVESIGGQYADDMPLVWTELMRLDPPKGWRPEGPDDKYVASAFSKVFSS